MNTERARERSASRKVVAAFQSTALHVVHDGARDLQKNRLVGLAFASALREIEREAPTSRHVR
jgi:hypothetical protein